MLGVVETAPPVQGAGSAIFWRAVLQVVLPSFLLLLGLFFARKRIVEKVANDRALQALAGSCDAYLAAIAAWIVAAWKIYDPTSWSLNSSMPVHALSVVVFIVSLIFSAKFLGNRAASAEREKIADLKRDNKLLEEHRNWLLETIDTIDGILGDKFDRTRELLKRASLTKADVHCEEDGTLQISVIVNSIHKFFQQSLLHSESLRLGIYILDDETKNSLILAHSWDGKTKDCFNTQSNEFLKLVRTEGIVSFVVKGYLSNRSLLIEADTATSQDFVFFRPNQKERIRSALVYRFIVPSVPEDRIWVIYMDSNRPSFFEVAKMPAYETFFQQATKRIAFEATSLQLLERIKD